MITVESLLSYADLDTLVCVYDPITKLSGMTMSAPRFTVEYGRFFVKEFFISNTRGIMNIILEEAV